LTELCFELRAPIASVLMTLARFEEEGAIKIRAQKNLSAVDPHAGRVAQLTEQAAVLRQSEQYNEAIALLEIALRMRPDAEAARESLKEALGEQLNDLYNQLPPIKVPVLVATEERLARIRLRPEERFLVERLGAQMDIGSLIMVSSLNERETLKLLRKLLHSNVIELR
jgi:tetratricopeptide (TPR) repeat protein